MGETPDRGFAECDQWFSFRGQINEEDFLTEVSRREFRTAGGTNLHFVSAGDLASPPVLLIHGFPSSSRTFRNVIPEIARSAYVIAPDLPGFGQSDPLPTASFEAFAAAIEELLRHLSIGERYIYLHDYGAPVGLQIAMRAPSKVLGLIIQNANAHQLGLGPQWADTRLFWRDGSHENEAKATSHLTFEGTRDQYIAGLPTDVATRIPEESWCEDWRVMQLPGRMTTQKELVKDYGRHVEKFGAVHAYLSEEQPPALLLWGRHDVFFDLAEVQSWMEDLPRMEAHISDAGHFLLETHAREASSLIKHFIDGR